MGVQFHRALSRRQARQKRRAAAERRKTARACQPMDGLATIGGRPGDHARILGLIRTPPEKRDPAAIKASQDKTTDAMKILDTQLGKTQYVAGPTFSYGDIPVGVMCYRYHQLVPGRPATPHLDRWYALISTRKAFHDHIGTIPLT